MNPDPFEHHLTRQPLRAVPAEWRAEILTRAGDLQSPSLASTTVADGDCKSPARASASSPISSSPSPAPWWREWLWPCPQAWAALAAVWVLLIALNFSTRDRSAANTVSAKALPLMPYAWREQQKLLAELFPPEPLAPPRVRVQPAPVPSPAPRSELRPTAHREEDIA
jgi:hypothetical protein